MCEKYSKNVYDSFGCFFKMTHFKSNNKFSRKKIRVPCNVNMNSPEKDKKMQKVRDSICLFNIIMDYVYNCPKVDNWSNCVNQL